jgi:hypothetical protein
MKLTMKILLGSTAVIASMVAGSAFALNGGFYGVSQKDRGSVESLWGRSDMVAGRSGTWCVNRAGCTSVTGNKVAYCHVISYSKTTQKWVQGQRWNKSWTAPAGSRLKDC